MLVDGTNPRNFLRRFSRGCVAFGNIKKERGRKRREGKPVRFDTITEQGRLINQWGEIACGIKSLIMRI